MKGNQFKDSYSMRPGIMKYNDEMKNVSTSMKIMSAFSWLANATNSGNPIEDVGKCMIFLALKDMKNKFLNVKI